jgi:hypothetical protein
MTVLYRTCDRQPAAGCQPPTVAAATMATTSSQDGPRRSLAAADCLVLGEALASYGLDSRLQTTLPLLTAARHPPDAVLLASVLVPKIQSLGNAVDANAAFLTRVGQACGLAQLHQPPCSGGGAGPAKRARTNGGGAAVVGGGGSGRDGESEAEREEEREARREPVREDIRCALKQLAREWSTDGATERGCTHRPVLEALDRHCLPPSGGHDAAGGGVGGSGARVAGADPFPGRGCQSVRELFEEALSDGDGAAASDAGGVAGAAERSEGEGEDEGPARRPSADGGADGGGGPLVLVPGAGLGRLAMEVASHGYRVQGCECSAAMAAVVEWLLRCQPPTTPLPSPEATRSPAIGRGGGDGFPPCSQARIHPFVHDGANRQRAETQVSSTALSRSALASCAHARSTCAEVAGPLCPQARHVMVPDQSPSAMLSKGVESGGAFSREQGFCPSYRHAPGGSNALAQSVASPCMSHTPRRLPARLHACMRVRSCA